MSITTRTTVAALAAGASVIAVAACGPTVSKTAALPSTFTPSPVASAPATSAPAAPATSAEPVTTGPLGTTFTVTEDGASGATSYTVTAVKVDQHAALTSYESLQTAGDHMAAVRFTVKGVTGQDSDDANNNASITGADTTEYPASFLNVTDGPNFNGGTFRVSPGQTVSGWVAFEVPAGASGFSSQAATWKLG
jgi:hypothetical protein